MVLKESEILQIWSVLFMTSHVIHSNRSYFNEMEIYVKMEIITEIVIKHGSVSENYVSM